MNCPQCTGTLVTLEFDRIEIDYCPDCEGIWLDSGEIDMLLTDGEPDDSFLNAMHPAHSKEKRLKCPICGRGMKKKAVGDDEPVVLDECPGHGLWFDRGELHRVLSSRALHARKEASRVVQLLDEIFAARG